MSCGHSSRARRPGFPPRVFQRHGINCEMTRHATRDPALSWLDGSLRSRLVSDKALRPLLIWRGTDSSNPAPSSKESANFQISSCRKISAWSSCRPTRPNSTRSSGYGCISETIASHTAFSRPLARSSIPVVTLGIGCSAKPDAFDPCVPIPGSKWSAINQVGMRRCICSRIG
jgi:hypothetical protein